MHCRAAVKRFTTIEGVCVGSERYVATPAAEDVEICRRIASPMSCGLGGKLRINVLG